MLGEVSLKSESYADIVSWDGKKLRTRCDTIAVEEPLEVYVDGVLSLITMRTPGSEKELALGYCFSEGLVGSLQDVGALTYCTDHEGNRVFVSLEPRRKDAGAAVVKGKGGLVYSSCGICGKDMVNASYLEVAPRGNTFTIPPQCAGDILHALERCQQHFEKTGATHAAGLFDGELRLLAFAEDVGRHNALDKAVGAAVLQNTVDDVRTVVLTSRLSYEMVLKVGRTRAEVVIGMSSPTSLAVELANRINLTALGFARQGRFNIYSGAERVTNDKQRGTATRITTGWL
jgi:FdhD protein